MTPMQGPRGPNDSKLSEHRVYQRSADGFSFSGVPRVDFTQR